MQRLVSAINNPSRLYTYQNFIDLKLLSPVRRRACINHVRSQFKVSERQACRVLGQHRCTQRHIPKWHADEDRLVADMIELARQFGRHGYRRIAALLREAGWSVNDGRIERLWRREGLKVPQKQPKKCVFGVFLNRTRIALVREI